MFRLALMTVFFILAGHMLDNVYALAMGFLAGHIAAFVVMMYRIPYTFSFRINFNDTDVRRILTNSSLLTVSGLITTSYNVLGGDLIAGTYYWRVMAIGDLYGERVVPIVIRIRGIRDRFLVACAADIRCAVRCTT